MNISIKNPSESIVQRLNQRAARNHRSPEDEALVILEEALGAEAASAGPAAVAEKIRRSGLRTPSESVEIIREFRDR